MRSPLYASGAPRYLVAFAAVGAATLLRYALDPLLGSRQPFSAYYVAVVAAAWAGGLGPAVLASALGLGLGSWLFIAPRGDFGPLASADLVNVALYAVLAGAIAVLGGRMRAARRSADATRRAAERELTERRAAEERLRDQAELIELSFDAILVRDLAGRVTFWSPGAQMTYGFGSDEAVGQLSHELLQTALAPQLHGIERALMASGRWEGELVQRRRDGSPVTVSSRWVLRRDAQGGARGVLEVNRDITRAKQIEAALRESEERFRLAAEAVNGLIYDWDPRSEQVRRSRGLIELIGIPPGEAAPTNAWWHERIHPDDRTRCLADMAVALAGAERYGVEYRVRHRDRRWVWVWDTGLVVRDADGTVVRVVGSAIDITARRQAEERLRADDARKDRFLATLAHELRNPLAPIRNSATLLERIESADPRVTRASATIDRQVRHMTRLIDDLLDVSRMTRGHVQLRRERVELSALVRQAIDQARPLLEAKHHRLTVALAAAPLPLHADPVRVVQAVTNLLHNAAKYSDAGGAIHVATELVDGNAVVSVRDAGLGIAPDVLPTVFDMFVQGDAAPARVQDGLGIGLTLVRELVELHGGRVEAHSRGLGQGAEFVITLPAARGEAPEPASPSAGAEPTRARRVLVVEDNADAAATFALLLELDGHVVRLAADGLAGVEAAREGAPDVAFVDIGLPGIDGCEVARRLRATPALRGLTLVALSGYGQEEDLRRAQDAGFDQYLTKPVEMDRVRALLASLPVGPPVPGDATGG